jgi:hypothetical protein
MGAIYNGESITGAYYNGKQVLGGGTYNQYKQFAKTLDDFYTDIAYWLNHYGSEYSIVYVDINKFTTYDKNLTPDYGEGTFDNPYSIDGYFDNRDQPYHIVAYLARNSYDILLNGSYFSDINQIVIGGVIAPLTDDPDEIQHSWTPDMLRSRIVYGGTRIRHEYHITINVSGTNTVCMLLNFTFESVRYNENNHFAISIESSSLNATDSSGERVQLAYLTFNNYDITDHLIYHHNVADSSKPINLTCISINNCRFTTEYGELLIVNSKIRVTDLSINNCTSIVDVNGYIYPVGMIEIRSNATIKGLYISNCAAESVVFESFNNQRNINIYNVVIHNLYGYVGPKLNGQLQDVEKQVIFCTGPHASVIPSTLFTMFNPSTPIHIIYDAPQPIADPTAIATVIGYTNHHVKPLNFAAIIASKVDVYVHLNNGVNVYVNTIGIHSLLYDPNHFVCFIGDGRSTMIVTRDVTPVPLHGTPADQANQLTEYESIIVNFLSNSTQLPANWKQNINFIGNNHILGR